MRKKISFGLLLTCAALFLTYGTPAMGKNITHCPAHYTDIDTVYWSTQSAVPHEVVQTDWSAVEQNVAKYLDNVIAHNSKILVIKTADSAEQVLAAHPKSLYLKVVFSYAPKESFTTPLPDNALVIWIETTRNESTQNKGITAFKRASRSEILSVKDDPMYLNGKFLSFGSPFFNGPSALLTEVGCDVLKYSSDKMCTHSNSSGDKIVDQASPQCVRNSQQTK